MVNQTKEKNIKDLIRQDPTLKASVRDGMAHAAMIGAGETYLTPFAIFLKATSFQIGLLAGLPLLIGAVFQSLGVWLIENYRSRLWMIITSALIQGAVWLPIMILPFYFGIRSETVSILIVLVAIYHIAGSIVLPAWNSLMGDLVPTEIRGNFFGYRHKRTGFVTFVALAAAGQVLHSFKLSETATVYGYFIIFSVAMLARLFSVRFLRQYRDPPYQVQQTERFSFLQFLKATPKSNFARFVVFFASMNFAAYLAGPFFGMYLLNDLQVSYHAYTAIIAAATISQFCTMHYWGRLTDQFGNRKIMSVCAFGVAILPLLWLFSANIYWLVMIQAYAGFVWAGFNLAGANFMFDAVTPPKRARCVAYQAIINAAFIFSGSFLGATLAKYLTASGVYWSGLNTPASVYIPLFILSGLIRFLVAVGMLRLFKEVREVEFVSHRDLIFRITSLRPLAGASFGLITGKPKDKP